MEVLPQAIRNAVDAFSQLPGIGPKTAQRLAFYLLRSPEALALNLGEALMRLKADTLLCEICCSFSDTQPCALCAGGGRDRSVICVVEDPHHVHVIERMGEYRGLYHVLHGTISPLDGVGPEDIRLRELMTRLAPEEGVAVQEVIVATSPNLGGQATAEWIARLLAPRGIKVTQLARGLASGSDIEFADDMTFRYALEGRKAL